MLKRKNSRFKIVCLILTVMMVFTTVPVVVAVSNDYELTKQHMGCCGQLRVMNFGAVVLEDGTEVFIPTRPMPITRLSNAVAPLIDRNCPGYLVSIDLLNFGMLNRLAEILRSNPVADFEYLIMCEYQDARFANNSCCGIIDDVFLGFEYESIVQGPSCGSTMCHTHIFVTATARYVSVMRCSGRVVGGFSFRGSWDFCQMLWR